MEWLGELHPEAFVAVAVLAAVYLRAWRVRGLAIDWTVASRGLAALVVGLASVVGPLHELSDRYLFSAHMVQHLVLTLIVPPLALAGLPRWMVDAILRPLLGWRVTARAVRWITRPVPAISAYAVTLIFWHLPGPYDLALASHAWHIVEHVALVAAAVLGWWPILSRATDAPPLPYGAQLLYLFVFGMPMTVVAALVTGADEVLYRFYAAAPRITSLAPLDDQRLGGLIMWVPAGVIPLIAFTAVFFRWAASEPDEP